MNSAVLALLFSIFGGFLLNGPLVGFMRKSSGVDSAVKYDSSKIGSMYNWEIFWLGSTERGITTTLFIFAPSQLPLFIAGWSAAKIAAGWGRTSGVEHSAGHMSALIGTAWSFCIAIAAGYWASPGSLAAFTVK
jgi:hypothetical protein